MRATAITAANWLISDLPKDETERLETRFERVLVRSQDLLGTAGAVTQYCYFPADSVVSMFIKLSQGGSVETGMIGCEGLVGFAELFGAARWTNTVRVHVAGYCFRIALSELASEMNRSPVLQQKVIRFAGYFLSQVSQTAACNRIHKLEQRFCRWLLLTQDRILRDRFAITHDFVSQVLGTPRSEISLAAAALRKAKLIEYKRGQIHILNRRGMESSACECYYTAQSELSLLRRSRNGAR
jgi:CRP-like cAMP-binding protein